MNIDNIRGYNLQHLGRINILLGKNGCGKSTLMRAVSVGLNEQGGYGNVKYLSPERGGALVYDPNIESNISSSPSWMSGQRLKNQATDFKKQTVVQYRNLETLILRHYEKDNNQPKFDFVIDEINKLLDNLQITREGMTFKIYSKDGQVITPEAISSGESELISLAIECLVFKQERKEGGNILFLDEPDVHLHPDLQAKLMHFVANLIQDDGELTVIIATHSTAILGAFENTTNAKVCFMESRHKSLNFQEINETYKKILPIFGAHPLSNIFNSAPLFIVEGEDDIRIWQQAVRSSEGKIKVYPCEAGSKNKITEMENDAKQIVTAVYDDAKIYSLRDRDDDPEEIEDELPIHKFRLSCRNAESLILSNEALLEMKLNWEAIKTVIDQWIADQEKKDETSRHKNFAIFKAFRDGGYNRKFFNLKTIRNDLLHFAGCNKPWEVLVGQTIANHAGDAGKLLEVEGSIFNFLGEKVTMKIFCHH